MARRFAYLILLLTCIAVGLSACGRKSTLELPPGEEDQRRTYPTK